MMTRLRDLGIARRLIIISALTSGATLLLTWIALTANEVVTYREVALAHATTISRMVAANSTAAIAFTDRAAADQTLSALKAEPAILAARILTRGGAVFASYDGPEGGRVSADPERDAWITSIVDGQAGRETHHKINGDRLDLIAPIILDGEQIGFVYVESGMDQLNRNLHRYLWIVILVGGVSFVLSLLLAAVLQRSVAEPIRTLVRAMATVSETRDYALRVPEVARDELRHLVDGFNQMLEQIEVRDVELERHRNTLEDQVRLRTAELFSLNRSLEQTIADLQIAKDRAEAASRAKSQFLANMSHEIRTPMNGVLGTIDRLRATALSAKQRRQVETIESSGKALLALISDILDLSKIEAGKLVLDSTPFDLRRLVDEVVGLFADQAHAKGIGISGFVPSSLDGAFVGDPVRLRQALLNLVGNALKFTSRGEIAVRVAAVGDSDAGCRLRFEVRDSGIGIPAEKQDEIFGVFAQADGSTTRRFGGSGLGLAITKQICEMMGGSIGVVSHPGVGSTFWFEAVMARGEPAAPKRWARADTMRHRPVLLAMDSSTDREIVDDLLTGWGLRPTVAPGARETLARLRAAAAAGKPFWLAVLEASGPDGEAVSLARRIAGDPACGSTRILIAIAGEAGAADSPAEATAGMSPGEPMLLYKPIRQSDLYDALVSIAAGNAGGMSEGDGTAAVATQPAEPAPTTFAAGTRVLLAEDNPVNREVAVDILEGFGCQVDVASNGRQALERAGKGEYDLIFMDCQMPELDGYDATRAIRKEEAARGWRSIIIALTANALDGDRERCLAAGMDDYLAKPITTRQLAAVLRRWMTWPEPPPSVSLSAGSPSEHGSPLPAPAPAILDMAVLEELTSLGESPGDGTLARIVGIFCETVPDLVASMQRGLTRHDHDAIARAAHNLKSSSAHVGALVLSERCKRLEAAVRNGDPAEIGGLVDAVSADLDAALEALRGVVGDRPGSRGS